MTYKIDKGIPLPKSPIQGSKYPFREMEIDDSVFFEDQYHSITSIRSAITYARKSTGWEFTTRKQKGGIRVWRIK
jgi:hypothetical protein